MLMRIWTVTAMTSRTCHGLKGIPVEFSISPWI